MAGSRRGSGITLLQLLLTISIMMLFTVVLVPLGDNAYGEAASVADELAGWLEIVQRRSQLLAGQACTVSFENVNEATLEAGAILARVSPASCAMGDAVVPVTHLSRPLFQQKLMAGSDTLVFTPRGTVTATQDTVLRLRRLGSPVIRCVRVSAVLGIVSRGVSSDAAPSATSSCPEASYVADLP